MIIASDINPTQWCFLVVVEIETPSTSRNIVGHSRDVAMKARCGERVNICHIFVVIVVLNFIVYMKPRQNINIAAFTRRFFSYLIPLPRAVTFPKTKEGYRVLGPFFVF